MGWKTQTLTTGVKVFDYLLLITLLLCYFFFFPAVFSFLPHRNGLTFLCNGGEMAAWQMCITAGISSAISAKALFVTSGAFNWAGTRQQHPLAMKPFSAASIELASCCTRSIYSFFRAVSKVCLHSKWQFMLALLTTSAKLSFETREFPNIASHFQADNWCCARPQTVKLIFVQAGCMRGEGSCSKDVRGDWSELCLHRGLQIRLQSYRSHCHPLRVLNYYHIYTCVQSAILFAYWPVECLENTAAKCCFEYCSLSALEKFEHISTP